MENKACRIVTIAGTKSLFKGEEPATSIEVVELEEVGNQIVSQKGLYKVGDRALFIQPDYCLSDIPLFQEYITPGGDPKKSKLGSNNRIRAVKFNLHTGDGIPVYSYGILIPIEIVIDYVEKEKIWVKDNQLLPDYDIILGITKWEEPEPRQSNAGSGKGVSCPFPEGMYKTDEVNINNVINQMVFPIRLIGLHKADGSSISIWYRDGKVGVASRNLGRPLTYNKVVGWDKGFWGTILEMITFGKYEAKKEKVYKRVENDDQFVKLARPYIEKLVKRRQNIVLRGEMIGKGCKGSGNKNNPNAKDENHIQFFGIDDYNGSTRKMPWKSVVHTARELDIPLVKQYFDMEFKDKEHLLEQCNSVFKHEKENYDKTIEGIVLRNPEGTFSCKCMNMEYDAKK